MVVVMAVLVATSLHLRPLPLPPRPLRLHPRPLLLSPPPLLSLTSAFVVAAVLVVVVVGTPSATRRLSCPSRAAAIVSSS